jgi:hypothetical protein
MMKRPWTSYMMIALIILQIISAVPAGIILVLDSSGAGLGMSTEMIDASPFGSFLIPGLFLLIVLGLFPMIIVYGLIIKAGSKFFQKLNLYKENHWSWAFSYYLGILLILWINMELIFIKEYSFLQVVYSLVGLTIIILTHLPITRRYYSQEGA